MKIKSFAENPKNIAEFPLLLGTEKLPLKLKKISVNGDRIIASIEGISDRNAAETLAGKYIYVTRENLPPLPKAEFYQHDLIGLEARLENGEIFGKIIAFHNFGAGDLLEIELPNGSEKMIPLNKETVPEINPDGGYLLVNPPEEV